MALKIVQKKLQSDNIFGLKTPWSNVDTFYAFINSSLIKISGTIVGNLNWQWDKIFEFDWEHKMFSCVGFGQDRLYLSVVNWHFWANPYKLVMAHHCLLELAILSPIQYLERIKVTTIRRELTSNWLLRKSRTFISLLGSPPPIKQPPSNSLTPEGITSCNQIWSEVSLLDSHHCVTTCQAQVRPGLSVNR